VQIWQNLRRKPHQSLKWCNGAMCNGTTSMRVEMGDWEVSAARREGVLGF
jgi:hypothetical protein